MITGQIRCHKAITAIQTNLRVTFEQCAVAQGWYVIVGQCFVSAVRGDYRIDLQFGAQPGLGVYSPAQFVDTRTKAISHPAGVIEAHGILIVYPFQRHPRRIGTENLLR